MTPNPSAEKIRPNQSSSKLAAVGQDWLILTGLWLTATLVDALWLGLDQSPPYWDQGDHLTRALNYWQHLQAPQLTDSGWWHALWRLSPSYRAPLVYLLTVPLFELLGRGFDQAVLVNSFLTAPLLLLVYGLARHLFDRTTGLWAAAVCTLVPILFFQRIDYLLDYGLVVCVLAGFTCLTLWRSAGSWSRWLWALGFGISCGLTVLAKPTGILFFLIPMVWVAVVSLRRSPWLHLLQWAVAAAVALLICWPWVQTNWLTILTSSGSSNSSWIADELDLESPWSVWTYYARMLPRMVTPPLVWGGLAGWIIGLIAWKGGLVKPVAAKLSSRAAGVQWLWLLTFVLGTYGLLSLLQNKDPRHILPYVPVVVVLLVRGLTVWSGRVWRWLRLALVAVMAVLMAASLFPVVAQPPLKLAKYPYRGEPWPQPSVVETVLAAAPYLRSTIGVLPNLAQMNPMNVDFYGALKNFQVFGREVGFSPDYAPLDARSLTWVLAKNGEQGPPNGGNAKAELQAQVEQSPDYQVEQTWNLPDGSQLALYHRQPQPVEAMPSGQLEQRVSLSVVTPPSASVGTVPVTYQVLGPWQALADGLLILSWQADGAGNAGWIHDHGIGLGNLYAGQIAPDPTTGFTVTERLAMEVPQGTPPGTYRLVAEYLNRTTGEAYPLQTGDVRLRIEPGSAPESGLEPDLVSQLHQLSQGLANGTLDPIFNTVSRINQYDPLQDYLKQAEQAMTYRSQQAPERLEWLYTRLMAQVLRQDPRAAIATLNQVTTVAPSNPYHWLYLGFVQLYRWHPGEANQALAEAEKLAPDMPELKALQAVAAAQQLNVWRAWKQVQASGLL